MERISRASKAFHRNSKNLRDSPPPETPTDRSRFGSLRSSRSSRNSTHGGSQDNIKFQISAPVELISSTNMLSYTSLSLRSPSPTGKSASSIGYSPLQSQHQNNFNYPAPAAAPTSAAAAAPQRFSQKIQPKVDVVVSPRPSRYQPPSPASTIGDSVKGPLSPELGLAISDVLTPPATPPPDHIPRHSRSSIGKSAGMSISSRQSGSLQRIRSTSSLSSSISNGSSHDSYKLENEEASQSSDSRRITSTFGTAPSSYKGPQPMPSNARPSNSPTAYNGLSLGSHSSPTTISPSTMPPPPPRVSAARRSVSNPNLKLGPKRSSSKTNPFAHELAQVSELAEDMGLDFVDNDVMVRKGLQKFSAQDYLAVIRDVALYPIEFDYEQVSSPIVTSPVVPLVPERRRKPAVTIPDRRHAIPMPHMISPQPVAGQSIAVGGWI
ncbi:hypothetical protein TWF106_004901 [Orbilia oligospora]|uniref:Uncharacterized protein n=1 Tax=Orbilia oligospora TaxID=2813651 RepID=A0A7C8UNF6_ORBOL|nr:hypothetical protein TWF106_004901 [Orbilia oligospora]